MSVSLLATLSLLAAQEPAPADWQRVVVDARFRSEACCIADVDGDGRPDLLAGDLWYRAPAWTPHVIREPEDHGDGRAGYSRCFACFADDVDRDGHVDELVVGFPGAPSHWFRNPGQGDGAWTQHRINDSTCNESPWCGDLFGDGRRVLVCGVEPAGALCWFAPGEDAKAPWTRGRISEDRTTAAARYAHGLGVGDVDGDGRADVIATAGFWSQPAAGRAGAGPWPFTAADLGPACAQMYALDLDGDGATDVVSSSAHARGVFWHRRGPAADGAAFARKVLSDTVTQTHALRVADLDGDGIQDIVTGKRFWAHGPDGDEDPGGTPVLVWLRIGRGDPLPVTPGVIDTASGVGTCFDVADVDGDGRPDVAVANKKGVFLFLQRPPRR